MPNNSAPAYAVPVTTVAVSPDGRYGASGDHSGEVSIWDLGHEALIASIRGPHHGRVACAAFGTGARRPNLLTLGPDPILWTIAAEAMDWRHLPHDGGRLFDHDERASLLTRLGASDWIGLFGPLGGRIQTVKAEATALTASGLILVGDTGGEVSCWRQASATRHADAEPVWAARDPEGPVRQRLMRSCDRGRLVVSQRRGDMVVRDAATGARTAAFVPPARPTAIAADPERPSVVLGGRDGSLSWWDASTGHCLGVVRDAHSARVSALALAAGMLMSVSHDGTAALWRPHDREPLARFTPSGASELTVVAGSRDGTRWLVGGRAGQVHILKWSEHERLKRHWDGRSAGAADPLDIDTLVDDLRHHWDHLPAVDAALRVLAGVEVPDEGHADLVEALADLVASGTDRETRERAVIEMERLDRGVTTTAVYRMFDRHPDEAGSGARLLTHFSGETAPSIGDLVASLPGIGNFLGALTQHALAEHGAAAVPALLDALRAFPVPAEEEDWWTDESTKGRLMTALAWIGPAAAPATPTLMEHLEDEEAYRDTRHAAEVALQAIGLPEAGDAMAREIRRRLRTAPPADDEDDLGISRMLDALAGLPGPALAASVEVAPMIAAIRKRLATPPEGEFVPYELRLIELIEDKIEVSDEAR
ncbi:hypothetical protein E1293_38130 [Actinomadura darangshiensis]|uniref:WD40 repeat domain-containing protein n=1 Tax=Actinomadura darangshiensis TaxID=705336 RepID=A0A4V2YS14_9ACTN|nr:hypothetical protein [Actinomadura darangshiensis]TDD67357.1 hypothetical protein E1293_38130 [Actinomadura darangshiensis]